MTSSRTSGGSCGRTPRSFVLTASITSIVLAPDWRRISSDDGRHAVEPRERALLLRCRPRPGRGRARGSATPSTRRDDQVVEVARVHEPAHGPQRLLACGVVTLPPGTSAFWRTIASRTAVIGQLVGRQPVGIDPDVDGALEPADDAAPRRRRAQRSSCRLTTLSASSVSSRSGRSARERDGEHRRRVVVELGDDRRLDVARQLAQRRPPRGRARPARRRRCRGRARRWRCTSDVPGPEIERSSSMPATVLTASSMRCETCGFDLLGRGAGQHGPHADRREVDRREAVDAQAVQPRRRPRPARASACWRRPAGGCRGRQVTA